MAYATQYRSITVLDSSYVLDYDNIISMRDFLMLGLHIRNDKYTIRDLNYYDVVQCVEQEPPRVGDLVTCTAEFVAITGFYHGICDCI
jgi:hypothetical protein